MKNNTPYRNRQIRSAAQHWRSCDPFTSRTRIGRVNAAAIRPSRRARHSNYRKLVYKSLGHLRPAAVTVQNTSTDRWTLTFPAEITFFVFALNGWTEPESALGNIVDSPGGLGSFGTNQLFVLSDFPTGSDIPDGTTLVQSLFVGDVRSSVNITFHDNAAANEGGSSVPDTGSTFGLLVVSLIALLGASRPLAVRLA